MSQSLIHALQNDACYDHPVAGLEIRETHISWVVLTGQYAYKIKKPLDFGFLDFSTLAKRKHFCEEEVRLNARLADNLYVETVPITGTPEQPQMGGKGEPFEYAVRMRQFDNTCLFSSMQATGQLTQSLMDDLVGQLVAFHQNADQVDETSSFGSPAAVHAPVKENFEQLRPLLDDAEDIRRLNALETWADEAFARLSPEMARRQRDGFIRETHGDVHLGNAVMHDGRALIFDCIEFNDNFRWNDVCCELAFLLMDLEARGEQGLAHHVLDRYLERSGDYRLVRLLPYYKAYRAMVRAKVAMLRLQQPGLHPADRDAVLSDYRRYVGLAERYSEIHFPYLLISVGVSGSGKSRFTEQVVRQLGGVRIRSDVERKRLFGLDALGESSSSVDSGIYTSEATERTYERLAELTGMLLESGYSVSVDATCLKRAQRDRLRHEAEIRGLPSMLISFEADEQTLKARIKKRSLKRDEVSEAGLEVLERQLASREPFSDEELAQLVHLDTTAEDANLTLVALIRAHLRLSS
ncbi:bifunctional aminoglycoside phosphotransferase/ATP-binding protein [Phytohalomonas tamaricis]|uniref:bifunctional aminoglycoside phosphotransferase/ATP-binding protein n=1 Tax=Phytohalomonas tamaricis TaxID=2081032 RepID=UPI000D0B26FA|nr:bifunctional aminoglycoside phosphotransferase/ATP-binding protein [Phytohalomonas tamaricis]